MESKIKGESASLFIRFKEAFQKYYSQFESEFFVDVEIVPFKETGKSKTGYQVEFQFSKKHGDVSSGKPENCSKKDFSKGKKVVYVMCLILALNSIESVV